MSPQQITRTVDNFAKVVLEKQKIMQRQQNARVTPTKSATSQLNGAVGVIMQCPAETLSC